MSGRVARPAPQETRWLHVYGRLAVADVGGTSCKLSLWDLRNGDACRELPAHQRVTISSPDYADAFRFAEAHDCTWLWIAAAEYADDFDTGLIGRLATPASSIRCVITNDVTPLLFALPVDAVVICSLGTGSSFISRDQSGNIRSASGHEYILTDDGSAYDVGVRGLRAAVRSWDGRVGQQTGLVEAMAHHFGCGIPEACRRLARSSHRKTEIASFARTVCDLAESGDKVAHQVLTDVVSECVLGVHAVTPVTAAHCPVLVCGGLPAGSAHFTARLVHALRGDNGLREISVIGDNSPLLAATACTIIGRSEGSSSPLTCAVTTLGARDMASLIGSGEGLV